MDSKEQRAIKEALEEEILQLIDNQDDYTRSDLQGIVSVIVIKAMKAGRKLT